ncbi:HemK2/MTQ2 family protein methyltransferase [Streptomyces sp. NBC_00316]|uniref:HemK2/MTQ2 family protein methyltransferase n=1 Tax=Streptomyces sp. NBC_00316 TaxID=2975710 RepID=UPI002E2B89C9|nr:HemK2/MTQ2 family protein methyltransferase [Streptomyces sp. NBC_00316]
MAFDSVGTAESSDPFLVIPPGVYAPQHDTRLLMAALARERIAAGADVLDLGTGSGALAVRAAQLGGRVTAVDIARCAVATTRLNALLHHQRITVRRSDLASAMQERTYDLILCNPPYVPAPHARVPTRGSSRAWDAGFDGRAVVDRVCDGAPAALRRAGVLLMVHSGLCDPAATVRRLSRGGLEAKVSARTRVPFGPVLLSRLGWLRARDLVKANDSCEELVVIRAERP